MMDVSFSESNLHFMASPKFSLKKCSQDIPFPLVYTETTQNNDRQTGKPQTWQSSFTRSKYECCLLAVTTAYVVVTCNL